MQFAIFTRSLLNEVQTVRPSISSSCPHGLNHSLSLLHAKSFSNPNRFYASSPVLDDPLGAGPERALVDEGHVVKVQQELGAHLAAAQGRGGAGEVGVRGQGHVVWSAEIVIGSW